MYPWFANYMVVKRAAQEPNFHGIYLQARPPGPSPTPSRYPCGTKAVRLQALAHGAFRILKLIAFWKNS